MSTLEDRIAQIQAREPELPSPEDLAALSAASAEGFENAVPLDDFIQQLEGYSGRLVVRLPRSLHKRLKQEADAEGVSLNQYMLYKLAR